jgi:hypothetical protein
MSISAISISGYDENASVGIDRSSLRIVWQRYGNSPTIEFGQCRADGRAITR